MYLKWEKVLDQIKYFKNPIYKGYYSLKATLEHSKYSLRVKNIFISTLILVKQDNCEII